MWLRNILLLIIVIILVIILVVFIIIANLAMSYGQDIVNALQNGVDNNVNPEAVWNYLEQNNITPEDLFNYLNQNIDDYFSSYKLSK